MFETDSSIRKVNSRTTDDDDDDDDDERADVGGGDEDGLEFPSRLLRSARALFGSSSGSAGGRPRWTTGT